MTEIVECCEDCGSENVYELSPDTWRCRGCGLMFEAPVARGVSR